MHDRGRGVNFAAIKRDCWREQSQFSVVVLRTLAPTSDHLESRRIATIRGRKQAPSRPPPQHLKRTNARGPRTTGVVVGVMVRAGRADIVL